MVLRASERSLLLFMVNPRDKDTCIERGPKARVVQGGPSGKGGASPIGTAAVMADMQSWEASEEPRKLLLFKGNSRIFESRTGQALGIRCAINQNHTCSVRLEVARRPQYFS